ncbi:MAG: rRNA maturation RNase YbeY [Pyrinomonadaceae bacterium]
MIVNLQRKIKIKTADYMPFLVAVRASVEEVGGGHFSVAFVSDKRMKELNKFFRNKDSTTDVLSFPHKADEFDTAAGGELEVTGVLAGPQGFHIFLGDIVISLEQAQRQAKENKLTVETEIKQLILHGALHLCGYDHETDGGEMNARELELREKLSI